MAEAGTQHLPDLGTNHPFDWRGLRAGPLRASAEYSAELSEKFFVLWISQHPAPRTKHQDFTPHAASRKPHTDFNPYVIIRIISYETFRCEYLRIFVCEKFSNDKLHNIMKNNPFKFGTIVDGEFFTDREDELVKISSYVKSENHLVVISPRRYGKTSLILKVAKESGRKYIYLDLQLVFSPGDFAAQLLKRIYRVFTMEKLKGFIKSFRLIPSVIINPVTGETEISFRSGQKDLTPLDDVLNLIGKLGTPKNKLIVILDEFQEIFRIGDGLDRVLRSTLQTHTGVNYVFLGSSESMIRKIFEKKSSPFYRFGTLITLNKIAAGKFAKFLEGNFKEICDRSKEISSDILKITGSHPFYTQQLAFSVWEMLILSGYSDYIVENAIKEIVQSHDHDYERLWYNINRTDMMVLTGIASGDYGSLSGDFLMKYGFISASTVFSSVKRLVAKGLLIKEKSVYLIDDPFFKRWILVRREF